MSFSIVVVSAAQETTIYSFPEGIDIVEQQQETIMYNTDYFYHFHLLNSSNGAVITNDTIYCSFFIANETGNVIFGSNVTYVGPYWEIKVDGTVIKIGESPYGLICIGENIGGSLSGTFNATSTGEDGSMFYLILLTSLAIIFLLASLFVDEEFFVYISGTLFLLGGIYLMINGIDVVNNSNTRNLSYIYIGIGLLFTIGAYIYNSYSKNQDGEESY